MKLAVNHHPTFNGEMFIRSFGWLMYSRVPIELND
jgi:hypothetical protein